MATKNNNTTITAHQLEEIVAAAQKKWRMEWDAYLTNVVWGTQHERIMEYCNKITNGD